MDSQKQHRRRPIKLPFNNSAKKEDWGSWVYTHRVGIFSTFSIFLLLIIALLSYRIIINPVSSDMIAIEFEREKEKPKELTPEEIKEKEIEKLHEQAFTKAQNKVSNENSKYNSSLRDAKKNNADQIYKDAERVSKELAAGKEAYEQGLKAIEQAGKPDKTSNIKSKETTKEGQEERRGRVQGDVFVSYNFADPDRTDAYLHVPAYQCQYGGTVVVSVVVNRNGKVVSANVDKSSSTSDDCIMKMAQQSALASSFRPSSSAPDRHRGTITYKFVAQ